MCFKQLKKKLESKSNVVCIMKCKLNILFYSFIFLIYYFFSKKHWLEYFLQL